MAYVIDVKIEKQGSGTYSVTCTPPSTPPKPKHGDEVTWDVVLIGVPNSFNVKIALLNGLRFPGGVTEKTKAPSGGAVRITEDVLGPRTAPLSTPPPAVSYDSGLYQVTLVPGGLTSLSGTESLMIDQGGPPPDVNIGPPGHRPGPNPHPGPGPGANP